MSNLVGESRVIKHGDISFSHPVKMGFYSKAVRWFTRSKWSHCFIIMEDFYGSPAVLEADLKVQLVDFNQEYINQDVDSYEIWRPILAKEKNISEATKYCYLNYAGETYGFLQIPWFAVRSILNFLGLKFISDNFNKDGIICSELLIDYLKILGEDYSKVFSDIDSNEASPEDIYLLVKSRPDLFQLITTKGNP